MALIRPRRNATTTDTGNGRGTVAASDLEAATTTTGTARDTLLTTTRPRSSDAPPEHDASPDHDASSDHDAASSRPVAPGPAAMARRRRVGQQAPPPPPWSRPRTHPHRRPHRSSVRPERAERTDRGDDYGGELIEIEGLLDLRDEGYGFLRASGYLAGRNDAYVSASQVRRFGLRKGDYVKGATRPPASSEKYPALVRVDLINESASTRRVTVFASKTSRRCSPTRGCGSSSTTIRSRSPAASSTSSRRSAKVSAA